MKEKPILFSTPMVQALLNTKPNTWPAEAIDSGKPYKWMTRRVIKTKAEDLYKSGKNGEYLSGFYNNRKLGDIVGLVEPPCQVGDILWVREKHRSSDFDDFTNEIWMQYAADGTCDYILFTKERFDRFKAYDGPKWRPSIFLPREASRLFLEVKAVRAERLQEITERDAKAEGVEQIDPFDLKQMPASLIEPGGAYGKGFILKKSYKAGFYQIWDHLNAKRGYSWDSNPWVWVYEFMRVERENEE